MMRKNNIDYFQKLFYNIDNHNNNLHKLMNNKYKKKRKMINNMVQYQVDKLKKKINKEIK